MKEHSILQWQTAVEANTTVIDVRSFDRFVAGHLPGAINIPLDTLEQAHQSGKIPINQPVTVVCQMGISSKTAADYLEAQGYDVTNLTEGMQAYTGPIEEGCGHE